MQVNLPEISQITVGWARLALQTNADSALLANSSYWCNYKGLGSWNLCLSLKGSPSATNWNHGKNQNRTLMAPQVWGECSLGRFIFVFYLDKRSVPFVKTHQVVHLQSFHWDDRYWTLINYMLTEVFKGEVSTAYFETYPEIRWVDEGQVYVKII